MDLRNGQKSLPSEDSGLEIGYKAFYGSGLETFAASPSLQRIGDLAFGACRTLRSLQLGRDTQLGWLCLWGTSVI